MKVRIKKIPKANRGKAITTMWGGSTDQLSVNPFDGGTLGFTGQSHEESSNGLSGIGISYAGNPVEVEGGETATMSPDGTLNVMGNLYIPGTRTKFKTASKAIAKQEQKYNNLARKGTNLVNSSDPTDNFERLKFNAGKLMMEGSAVGQKDLADKKQVLSSLQKAILDTAEEEGICADCLSKGVIKKARNGYTVTPKAQPGIHMKDDEFTKRIKQGIGSAESSNKYFIKNPKKGATSYGKYQFTEETRRGIWKRHFKSDYPKFEDFDADFKQFPTLQEDVMSDHIADLRKRYGNDEEAITLIHRLGPKGYQRVKKDPSLLDKSVYASVPESTDKETPRQYLNKVLKPGTSGRSPGPVPKKPVALPNVTPANVPAAPPFSLKNYQRSGIKYEGVPDPNTNIGTLDVDPRNLPSNVEPLDFNQILPELYALATNQIDPVQAQKYQPQLYVPYTVRFDDQLLDNDLTFRGLSQLYPNNPEALSFLAAQKYTADNRVKAEEFRTNQAIQQDVTNKNISLLNDAQLKNLGIMDTQYVRQTTAKAKTEAQNQVILNSIANKFLQNRLENKRLAAYENLYDYRFVDTDEDSIPDTAKYFGDTPVFNAGVGTGATGGSRYTRQRVEERSGGKKTTTNYPSEAQNEKLELDIREKQEKRFNLNKLFNR